MARRGMTAGRLHAERGHDAAWRRGVWAAAWRLARAAPALALAQLLRPSTLRIFSARTSVHRGSAAMMPFLGASDRIPTVCEICRLSAASPGSALAGGNLLTGGKARVTRQRSRVRRNVSVATKIKQITHVGRYPRMWRESWLGPANLDRANLRITGMETYSIIAAVLLQVILGLYSSIERPDENDPRVMYPRLQMFVFEIQMTLLMVAVLCSTYTMVMFLMIKVYSVTALGLHLDVAHEGFILATQRSRAGAFWSLIAATCSFLVAFALNLYSKVKGNKGLGLSFLAMCFLAALFREGMKVLSSADAHIFQD